MKIYVCTNQQNGMNYVEQNWQNCFTCNPEENLGVCIPCAKKCHVGHNLGEIRHGSFFCDCGAGALENDNTCECYTLSDQDIIIRALNAEIVEKPITCQISMFDIEGLTSPHALFTSLGLLSTIYDCGDCTYKMTGKNDLLLFYSQNRQDLKMAIGIFGIDTDIDDLPLHIDSQNTMDVINEFVSTKTDSMIPELLDSEPEGDRSIVSAIYFDMNLDIAFDEDKTTEIEFTGKNGTVLIEAMRRFSSEASLIIRDPILFSTLLPYGNEFFAILTLPTDHQSDIRELIDQNTGFYHRHLNISDVTVGNGYVSIPKIKKEYTHLNLIQELAPLGLDVKGIRERTGIDSIIHKVVIDMNEKGDMPSEACTILTRDTIPNDFEWVGDIPYALAIVSKIDPNRDGTLLFSGIVDHTI